MSGATSAQVPFTLDADEVALVGRRAGADAAADAEDQLDSLAATGAVDFRLSDGLRARGKRLIVKRSTGILRLDGDPAVFEFGGATLETDWVEFDPVLQILVATGPGNMKAQATAESDDWSVDFLSASTLLELDSVVLVAPVWAGRIAAPMRSFVAAFANELPDMALISVAGSAKTPPAADEVSQIAQRTPLVTAAFAAQEIANGSCVARLQAFGDALRARRHAAPVRPVEISSQSV